MEEKGITRIDVEKNLQGKGDYVKIDYLMRVLKRDLDFDTRKFALIKLIGIYESKKMFLEAGKLMRIAADINTTFKGKIQDYLKSIELFVWAGSFVEADISYTKCIGIASESEKIFVKDKVKDYYRTQAKSFIGKGKRSHAVEAFEKLLNFELSLEEKRKVNEQLLELYGKLGKIREYEMLKRSMKL